MKTFLLVLNIVLIFCTGVFCQNMQKVDSLRTIVNGKSADTLKVKAFSQLSYIYRIVNIDTSLLYCKLGLELAKKIKWNKGLSICNKSFGNTYYEAGNYEKSINHFIKSLKIDEQINDQKSIAGNYSSIGSIYHSQGRLDKAEEYYRKSLKMREEQGDRKGLAGGYNNIGLVYYDKGDYEKAIEYNMKSLKCKEGMNDKYGVAGSYNNIGMVYSESGKFDLAIKYYKESLKIRQEIGDTKGIAAVLGNLSILNLNLADSEKNDAKQIAYVKEAIRYGKECYEISDKAQSLLWINKTAESLYKAYMMLDDAKNAVKFADVYIRTSDSLYKTEKIQAIASVEAKYETEKKEKQIEMQKALIEKKEAEAKQNKIMIYSILSGLLLVVMLLVVSFYAYRSKRKSLIIVREQKAEIEEKNEELNQQKEEITTQRDEIEQQRDKIILQLEELNQKNEEIEAQRDEILSQKEVLQQQKMDITDSINYAQRIQHALLPDESSFSIFSEYFVFYKPRDIVSGDFYLLTKTENKVIFCVADCTGHGVPGAFMSMLGISFINEIINKKRVTEPEKVLNELREYIIETLGQKGDSIGQHDGMDIAFCTIDMDTLELKFAGANSSILISRNDNISSECIKHESFDQLTEIFGDKQPIAFSDGMKPFCCSSVQLRKGDMLYMFSDGFESQLGGEKGKKFLARQFRALINEVTLMQVSEQRNSLDACLGSWMNYSGKNYEQTDDITVVGVKI